MSENAEKNAVLKQTLYLVATPIGNMSDITERAVKVLSEADFIAAEDTRKTGLLLNRLGISSELISYYDHNKEEKGPKIIERIKNGESARNRRGNSRDKRSRRRSCQNRYRKRNKSYFHSRRMRCYRSNHSIGPNRRTVCIRRLLTDG